MQQQQATAPRDEVEDRGPGCGIGQRLVVGEHQHVELRETRGDLRRVRGVLDLLRGQAAGAGEGGAQLLVEPALEVVARVPADDQHLELLVFLPRRGLGPVELRRQGQEGGGQAVVEALEHEALDRHGGSCGVEAEVPHLAPAALLEQVLHVAGARHVMAPDPVRELVPVVQHDALLLAVGVAPGPAQDGLLVPEEGVAPGGDAAQNVHALEGEAHGDLHALGHVRLGLPLGPGSALEHDRVVRVRLGTGVEQLHRDAEDVHHAAPLEAQGIGVMAPVVEAQQGAGRHVVRDVDHPEVLVALAEEGQEVPQGLGPELLEAGRHGRAPGGAQALELVAPHAHAAGGAREGDEVRRVLGQDPGHQFAVEGLGHVLHVGRLHREVGVEDEGQEVLAPVGAHARQLRADVGPLLGEAVHVVAGGAVDLEEVLAVGGVALGEDRLEVRFDPLIEILGQAWLEAVEQGGRPPGDGRVPVVAQAELAVRTEVAHGHAAVLDRLQQPLGPGRPLHEPLEDRLATGGADAREGLDQQIGHGRVRVALELDQQGLDRLGREVGGEEEGRGLEGRGALLGQGEQGRDAPQAVVEGRVRVVDGGAHPLDEGGVGLGQGAAVLHAGGQGQERQGHPRRGSEAAREIGQGAGGALVLLAEAEVPGQGALQVDQAGLDTHGGEGPLSREGLEGPDHRPALGPATDALHELGQDLGGRAGAGRGPQGDDWILEQGAQHEGARPGVVPLACDAKQLCQGLAHQVQARDGPQARAGHGRVLVPGDLQERGQQVASVSEGRQALDDQGRVLAQGRRRVLEGRLQGGDEPAGVLADLQRAPQGPHPRVGGALEQLGAGGHALRLDRPPFGGHGPGEVRGQLDGHRVLVLHAPDAPVVAVPVGAQRRVRRSVLRPAGVVVDRGQVVEVEHVEGAVRPRLGVHGPEPGVGGGEELRLARLRGDVARALRPQDVPVHQVDRGLADEVVPRELVRPGPGGVDRAARGRGEAAHEVDLHVGGAGGLGDAVHLLVIDDLLPAAGLADPLATERGLGRQDVAQVGAVGHGEEELSVRREVEAPGVRAVGADGLDRRGVGAEAEDAVGDVAEAADVAARLLLPVGGADVP